MQELNIQICPSCYESLIQPNVQSKKIGMNGWIRPLIYS